MVASFGISICFYIFTISGILGAIYVFYEFNPDSKSINLEKNQELEILSKWLFNNINFIKCILNNNLNKKFSI